MKRITTFEHAMQSLRVKKCGQGSRAFYLILRPEDDRLPADLPSRIRTYTEAQALRRTLAWFSAN